MGDITVISVDNVTKSYRTPSLRKAIALDQVSLAVKKGDIFGFLGPNGAGKTSLIKIIVGIMGADSGSCKILGLDTRERAAKLKLGYVPERPYYHDFLTAEEFLKFHGRLLGMDKGLIADRIPVLLDRVGLARARQQRLRSFSKGMLQRAGLAQALLHDPEILVLDEPMSGLDPAGRREVRDLINEIAAAGKTIFFSTHIIHDVEVICSTVGFIDKGKLQGLGNIESLMGKTVRSVEVRFTLPSNEGTDNAGQRLGARRTMDGWMLNIESDPERLEDDVSAALATILGEKGRVKAVTPRKSTLEDLFFGDSK